MSQRLIDANLNRLGEGIRILEEVARFLLNDGGLYQQLRGLRHNLIASSLAEEKQFLSARQVEQDVGAKTDKGERRANLVDLVIANARRAEESLRVLEEFGKLPQSNSAQSAKFGQARFALYQLEQQLVSRLLRQEKTERLSGLYVIVDTQALECGDAVEVACQTIQGGATTIQLRDKKLGRTELLSLAQRLKELCVRHQVLFIVNDYLDIALAVEADGLHLGQKDLPIAEARRFLAIDQIIGSSVSNLDEAIQAQSEGADYLAVGSIYPTTSKAEFKLAGLETLSEVKKALPIPVIAIGGIEPSNVEAVIRAGADGVAVIKAVLAAEDITKASRQMVEQIHLKYYDKANSENPR
jgi:thiamine-phosphate pyrophosphorylase